MHGCRWHGHAGGGNDERIQRRVAPVTGGRARAWRGGGQGARGKAGAKVVVSDILDGNETAAAIGGAYVKHDVTSEDEWIAAIQFAKDTFGGLDILVNNVGVFWVKPMAAETLESFRKMQAVNIEGVFLGMKHAIRIANGGMDGGGAVNLSRRLRIMDRTSSPTMPRERRQRLMTKGAALEAAPPAVWELKDPGIIDMMAEAAKAMEQAYGPGLELNWQDLLSAATAGSGWGATSMSPTPWRFSPRRSGVCHRSELVVDGGMTAI
ncbi:MAG: SDR family oxidoreductase [Hyphomonadaceae bacterium]